mgnify:FL=1
MFEEYWVEYTEIIADEEIKRRLLPPQSSIQLPNWLDPNCDPDSELYFGEEVLLEDNESLKKAYCDELDELHPSSLERLQILFDDTDWAWTYTTEFGDNMEVEAYEVAIVIAAKMLGGYLQILIHKHEREQTGYLAFEIDEVHQSHYLAQQLKNIHEHKSTTLQLKSEIPKKTISERAAKGGKARAIRYSKIKKHIIEIYESSQRNFNSTRQASIALAEKAKQYCEQHQIDPLADSNAQRTIYEWLRKHKNNKNL